MTKLDLGTALGIAGLVVGIAGVLDGRRQRTKREAAVNIVNGLIGRLHGVLVHVRAEYGADPERIAAINDDLQAISNAKTALEKL